jgi:drug/metabolite transporter (DMT)-like permease
MIVYAVALIIAAAFLHAGWNFLAKTSRDTIAFMWWAMAFGTIGYSFYFLTGPVLYLAFASWLPFVVSALAETGYYVTLVRGYSHGDLSLVYPISRGSAPIFAAVWGALLLGERLPWVGYLGILLMVVGAYVVSLNIDSFRMKFEFSTLVATLRNPSGIWAFACGVFISIYSVSDKVVVSATAPLVYGWWVFAGNTLLWAPVAWRKFRVKASLHELRSNWSRLIAGTVMTVAAYAAVLVALSLTSASYVVAGRGLSIVIGALLGSLVLRERAGAVRITGAVLMVMGLGLIAFS